MKKIFRLLLLVIALSALISCTARDKEEDASIKNSLFTGTWLGYIEIPTGSLALVFNILKTDTGFTATLDSPDQGVYDIPASSVEIDKKELHLKSAAVAGSFKGTLQDDNTIEGTWTQGGGGYDITLNRSEKVSKPDRPQTPTKPFPYTVQEITFKNPSAGITLAGTLTIPENTEPYPIVILISGSGPQNRDEELFSHKPFMVIADFLTKNGIAVLRFDDRGVAESEGDFASATSSDFVTDAAAAVQFVKTNSALSISSIGIIGHSEGAMIAPVIAAESSDVDFIIMLAGTVLTGEEVLYQQTKAIMAAQGVQEAVISENLKLIKEIYPILLENDVNTAETKLREIGTEMGLSEQEIDAQLNQLTSPWFMHFLSFSSKPQLESLSIPVLAVTGSVDLQVLADENLTAIETALKTAGNKNYKIKKYENLNHLFQHSETGAIEEYGSLTETFSEEVLQDISDWIHSIL